MTSTARRRLIGPLSLAVITFLAGEGAAAQSRASTAALAPELSGLGAILLAAGRPKEAEEVDRADLTRFRENGWSLFGLWQGLHAQGRGDNARLVRARFDKAWARADLVLTSSRMMPVNQPRGGSHAQPRIER
jgi:hypothetical protein